MELDVSDMRGSSERDKKSMWLFGFFLFESDWRSVGVWFIGILGKVIFCELDKGRFRLMITFVSFLYLLKLFR